MSGEDMDLYHDPWQVESDLRWLVRRAEIAAGCGESHEYSYTCTEDHHIVYTCERCGRRTRELELAMW